MGFEPQPSGNTLRGLPFFPSFRRKEKKYILLFMLRMHKGYTSFLFYEKREKAWPDSSCHVFYVRPIRDARKSHLADDAGQGSPIDL